jgi:hypothetical protein
VPTNEEQSIPPNATIATEGGKAAQEPPIDLPNEDSELLELEFVDFSACGKVIPAGLERPPRDIDEPRLWTMTDDTARFISDRRSQAGYDEYLHIGCYAFVDSYAIAAIGEGMDSLSSGPPLSHSLRKGAASVASCIGAPLYVVKYMGGWANKSSMSEGKYIDPTMIPYFDPVSNAWLYFGWLVPARPFH